MTEAMIAKARRNAVRCGLGNVDVRSGAIEQLPLATLPSIWSFRTASLTFAQTNRKCLAEAFRVLRPGGRLQMADILLEPQVTPDEVATKGAWSD